MSDSFKSRNQLLDENHQLKQRIAELESGNAAPKNTPHGEQPYRALFEQAGDSIFIVDPYTQKIIDVNDNGARRLGYSPDELRTMRLPDFEILNPETQESVIMYSWESTHSGTYVYECAHRTKDGRLIPVEVSCRLISVNGQEALQNIVRDLSKRKLAEQQERELVLERERISLISRFIEQASHEFRTPLSIISTSSFLMSKSDDAGKRAQHFEVVNGQIANINKLVDGLLMLSNLAKQDAFELKRVDLAQVSSSIIQNVMALAEEQEVQLLTEIPQKPIYVNGHLRFLSRALEELLKNALQNTHSGGEVLLRVHTGHQMVALEVHDNGLGISDEDLPHIFETFYRVDMAGTTRGFGLGLPIARMIAELHHGVIDVETVKGRGSLFRMSLPRAE